MRKIILYVACSLDGKIADREGNVDWLDTIPNPDHSDYGYSDFIKSVDTTLMGNKTYQQVLGFDVPFPYKETKNYVITRDGTLTNDENVEYIHQNIADFVSDLKNKPGKDIWCIGGGQLVALLLDHKLLDKIQVFIMPIILGEGIPLTGKLKEFSNLEYVKSIEHSSGVMEFHYILSAD